MNQGNNRDYFKDIPLSQTKILENEERSQISGKDTAVSSEQSYLCGEDIYGNFRGYCTICADTCRSYCQSGMDDLRCSRCGCGASAHKLFSLNDLHFQEFISTMTGDILPKLNETITANGLNFDSILVMYKVNDPNANHNQFSWLYRLLREAGFRILKAEIKQLRKNNTNGTVLTKLASNIDQFQNEMSKRFSVSSGVTPKEEEFNEKKVLGKSDTTFKNLVKTEEKLKYQSFTDVYGNSYNNDEDSRRFNDLRASSLYQSMVRENSENSSFIKRKKTDFTKFDNYVLAICISLDRGDSINYFKKFHYAINHSDLSLTRLVSMIELVYFSRNKICALWDVQVMFPELFKVNKIFQLIQPKVRKAQDFDKYFSIYKDALLSNSFNLVENRNFRTLSELRQITENEIQKNSTKSETDKKRIGVNITDLYENYLSNQKLKDFPCSMILISNVGLDKEINYMSSSLAFNNNLTIVDYDNEGECEEIANFYFNIDTIYSLSTYDRVMVIFRPFVLRSGLNEILLNIFRINDFQILSRKITTLTRDQLSYLYNKEFPGDVKITFNEYDHMMTDSNVEIIVLSKFSAMTDVQTLLGFNKEEVNVNLYNILESSVNYAKMKVEYEIDSDFLLDDDPIKQEKIIEKFKSYKTATGRKDKNSFKDISSLVDVNQIMLSIIKEKQKLHSDDLYSKLQKIKFDILKFASFFNPFAYCDRDKFVSEQQVNYFCPKLGEIEECFVFTKDFNFIKNVLTLMRFEILEKKEVQLNDFEFTRLFEDYYKKGLVTEQEYSMSKQVLLNNPLTLVRMIKPGGFCELKKLVGKQNFHFLKDSDIARNCISQINQSTNKWKTLIELLKYNIYLIYSSVEIEYYYRILNERITKIEGSFLTTLLDTNKNRLIEIIKSAIKCTVGENMRFETKNSIRETTLIERYLNFYHFCQDENFRKYFIDCLREYMFPKFYKSETEKTNLESRFYEYIKDNNDSSTSITSRVSFFVESTNLGFYEVRVPILEYCTKNGWVYLDMLDYLTTKFFLYTDKNFYDELVAKTKKDILISYFPFEEDSLKDFFNFKLINEMIEKNKSAFQPDTSSVGSFNENTLNFSQNEKEIKRRLLYMTKFESTKLFYKKCTSVSPKSHIVPQSYNYRIKPDDIYMDIKRIYEVEEFGGLFFIEIAIQDYMKYRPPERGERIEDGRVFEFNNNLHEIYPDLNVQFSLPSFLWGRKLMKICSTVEDSVDSPVKYYGPTIYFPKASSIIGVINDTRIKEYEMFLYYNILEDIRTCNFEFFSNKNFEIVEKKLYEIFNSEIFTQTRVKENIRLVPTRILENNLRVCKSNPNTTGDSNQIDTNHEMKFHSMFKAEEEFNFNQVKDLKERETSRTDPALSGSINRSGVSYETRLQEPRETQNEKISMASDMMSKNVYLIDLFCHNGMKYHMYAAIKFLIQIYYRKIARRDKIKLITLPLETDLDREKEYDRFLDAIMAGFNSHTKINTKEYNDKNRYNAYHVEFFFYCLKEIKFLIQETELLRQKANSINNTLSTKDEKDEDYEELKKVRDRLNQNVSENILNLEVIFNEVRDCPLQQSEEDLDDYKYKYAPKERYHIPMFIRENWERDLSNPKYVKKEKVEYSFLRNLKTLNNPAERQMYSSTGFTVANDYFFINRSLLRKPDPEPEKRILLEKKPKDKDDQMKNKYFGKEIRKEIQSSIMRGKENPSQVGNSTFKEKEKTFDDWLKLHNTKSYK